MSKGFGFELRLQGFHALHGRPDPVEGEARFQICLAFQLRSGLGLRVSVGARVIEGYLDGTLRGIVLVERLCLQNGTGLKTSGCMHRVRVKLRVTVSITVRIRVRTRIEPYMCLGGRDRHLVPAVP